MVGIVISLIIAIITGVFCFVVVRRNGERENVLDNGKRIDGIAGKSEQARCELERTEETNRDIKSTVDRISSTDKSSEDLLKRNRDILARIKERGDNQ
jgi:hypothetical protein